MEPHASPIVVAIDRESEGVAVKIAKARQVVRSKRDVMNVHGPKVTPSVVVGRAMATRKVVVATHGHCFDGMCSAALFTRLLRHVEPNETFEFTYKSMGYGPGQNGVDPAVLTGDVNAILDYRYSQSPNLTWYFDHHVSAFPDANDRENYEAHAHDATRRMFHDGKYGSCTKLIADVGASTFGLDSEPLKELITWADMIDTASFPSAKMAVQRDEPVLKLMTVVEALGDDSFVSNMVPLLLQHPLNEIANSEAVQKASEPLLRSHQSFVTMVTKFAVEKKGVVVVDLTHENVEAAGKFITYALYPDSLYSVVLTRSKSKLKISIGYNPWAPRPRTHNIAQICERHGGGGHPVVGAISFPLDKIAEAKAITEQIAEELRT